MRWFAGELTETCVETQAARFRITGGGSDKKHLRLLAAGLLQEVFDEQKVVEIRRQCHAADGDDLALDHLSDDVLSVWAILYCVTTTHAFAVMRMLADGEFHSGSALARALGVSRGTVWNAVRALGEAGLEVYGVKARGYRLAEPLSVLEASAIARHAGAAGAPFQIEVVDVTDSTNTLLMQRAANGEHAGTVLAAEWQRHGRGRMQRPWHAGLGGAITFSLLWRFRQGAAGLAGLSLVVGLALARTLSRHGACEVQLKWPNDVLWRGRKLAGVLIEMHGDALGPSTVVIGIGVNVRLSNAVRKRIDQAATDLESACGHPVDRNALIGSILPELASMLDRFAVAGFAPLREEWERYNIHQGKRVNVKRPDGRAEMGVVRGVADDGALVLVTQGVTTHVHSAEVSLRSMRAREDRPMRVRARSRA